MCEITDWQSLLLILWSAVEYWLGKTSLVSAGSTLELILNGIRALIGFVKPTKGA